MLCAFTRRQNKWMRADWAVLGDWASRREGTTRPCWVPQGQHPWSEASPALTRLTGCIRKHLETYLMVRPVIRGTGLIRRSLWAEESQRVCTGIWRFAASSQEAKAQSFARWVHGCSGCKSSPLGSESMVEIQRPAPCSSLARTTAVMLIWLPHLPSPEINEANWRITQMCSPCWGWLLEVFFEIGRRVGIMDHGIFLILGPPPQHIIQCPKQTLSFLGTKVLIG